MTNQLTYSFRELSLANGKIKLLVDIPQEQDCYYHLSGFVEEEAGAFYDVIRKALDNVLDGISEQESFCGNMYAVSFTKDKTIIDNALTPERIVSEFSTAEVSRLIDDWHEQYIK